MLSLRRSPSGPAALWVAAFGAGSPEGRSLTGAGARVRVSGRNDQPGPGAI